MKNHIPNFITLLNLLSGLLAISFVMSGALYLAGFLILLAAIFDFFDGLAARLLHAYSDTGKELDSLADVVSFGVAPSFIMYKLLSVTWSFYGFDANPPLYKVIIVHAAFLLALCAAVRLARFNTDSRQTHSFRGLPTPAAALFIAALPLILQYETGNLLLPYIIHGHALLTITVVLSFLMISGLPMFSIKFRSLSFQKNAIQYVFILICLILLITLHFVSIPVMIILYVLLSAGIWIKSGSSKPLTES
jgi:CDP-diacylglycerol--serine O-phosphatidyltransferase